jgi:hypothetical protein
LRDRSHHEITSLHDPPQSSDFAGLTLPKDDIEDVERCRPANCALKLAGVGLAELKSRMARYRRSASRVSESVAVCSSTTPPGRPGSAPG